MKLETRNRSVARVGWLTLVTLAGSLACGDGGGGDGQSAAVVTEPVRHLEVKNALVGMNLEADAIGYVKGFNQQLGLGLSGGDDYQVRAVVEDAGLRHVRLAQTYQAVPVVGAEIVVHAGDDTFVGFNGYVTKNLDGFDVAPAFTADQALGIAKTDYSPDAIVYSHETSSLVILPRAVE